MRTSLLAMVFSVSVTRIADLRLPLEFGAARAATVGFGGGIDYPIGDTLGFRLGLRGIVTFLDDNEDEFCDSPSNCPILIDDNALVQWEIFTGLSVRF